MKRSFIIACIAGLLSACGTTGSDTKGPAPQDYALVDTAVYLQKDPRWARDSMGGSGEAMEDDGCLVTATAMVLSNLGFRMNPGDLNARLKRANSYTSQGWLIWSGIEKVTNGQATARYYDEVSDNIIMNCIRDGFYPLARFSLANGRSHWAMILHRDNRGYHMRDPLHPSQRPLIYQGGARGFKAIRCVGRSA